MRAIPRAILLLLLILTAAPLYAQTATPPAEGVAVTFPPPVSLLRGAVEIVGTANADGQSAFFVQFRPLDATLAPVGGEDALWSPATTPRQAPIIDGPLGTWDTTLLADGLYELELVVNRGTAEPLRVRVSPLRVENTPPTRVYRGGRYSDGAGLTTTPTVAALRPTPTALDSTSGVLPTVAPLPTVTLTALDGVDSLTVIANAQTNIRTGDSTLYPVVTYLDVGESAVAFARSSRSTWIQVRTEDGDEGFISPNTLNIDGDTSLLPSVIPPPPPYTATPVPTATPIATATPITQANLRIINMRLDPSSPQCGQTFNIIASVLNTGTGPANASGLITVQDRHISSGTITETTLGSFSQLGAGEVYETFIPITVTAYYNEAHRIELSLDPYNQVAETDKNDNSYSYEYTLGKGGC